MNKLPSLSGLTVEELHKKLEDTRAAFGSECSEYRRIRSKIGYMLNPGPAREYRRKRYSDPEVRKKDYLANIKRLLENPDALEKQRTANRKYYLANSKKIQQKRKTPSHSRARNFMRRLNMYIHDTSGINATPEFHGICTILPLEDDRTRMTAANALEFHRSRVNHPGFSFVSREEGSAHRNGFVCPRMEYILGCSAQDFRHHFENLFTPEMTWDFRNYGKVWWIGHIKPVRDFDCTDDAQFLECFHYTNLRPELVKDNLKRLNEVRKDPTLQSFHEQVIALKMGKVFDNS